MDKCVFHRDTKIECAALDSCNCRGCAFRKTEKELTEGRQKSIARLENLPHRKFNEIMLKYYRFNRFNDDSPEDEE